MKGEGATSLREAGAFEGGATWIAYPDESMQRASHALEADDGVWLVDPVDAEDLDDWVAERGSVAGVVVLLDRHTRGAAAIARRHDVAVHVPAPLAGLVDDLDAPVERFRGELADTGYRPHQVIDRSFWRECALYRPADGTLVVPEAVGTAAFFRTADERLGVHPALRVVPPRAALGDLRPDRVLVGHGDPVLEEAGSALADALAGARRRAPRLYAGAVRQLIPV